MSQQSRPQVERTILEYETRYSNALRDIERLDDAAENLEARIERLSRQDVSIEADVSINSSVLNDLEALDSATYTPEIDPTIDDAPIKAVTDLDSEVVTPEVDTQETTEGKAVLDRLDEIRNLQAIQIALNLTGRGKELLENVVGLLGESEAAAARLTAQIGEELPNAEARLGEVYETTGASREDIARLFAQGLNLGIDPDEIDAVVTSALGFATVFDEDVNSAITTANQLVERGLAENFTEAFDLITVGFQEGANRGGDFLDVLNEYGTTFADLGLTGEETLSLITSGLEAGFDNADRIADAVREFGIRATNDENTQAALTQLGLPTPEEAAAAGELTGGEYLNAVFAALGNVESATERTSLTQALFATQSEDFGVDTLLNLDAANEFFDTIEGRAEEASTAFNDTLGATVAEFFRSAQVSIEGFLNNSTFRQTLDDFKTSLQDTLDALSSGESLPEAIEIGFKVTGFSDQVDRIQSAIGNFVISLLEMIANVQSFLGKDASGTQAEIARLAGGQLAFDVQNVDPAEIGNVIKTALDRGVSEADVGTAINTAIQEQLAAGNIQAAQELIGNVGLANATLNVAGIGGFGAQSVNVQQQAGETLADFEARLVAMRDAFIQQAGLGASGEFTILPTVDTAESQQAITDAITQLETDLSTAVSEGRLGDALDIAEQIGNSDYIGAITGQIQDAVETAKTAVIKGDLDLAGEIAASIGDEELIGRIEDLATTAEETGQGVTESVRNISSAAEDTATAVDEATGGMSTAFEDAEESIGNSISGNSIVPDIESILTAAEENLPEAGSYAKMFASDLQALDRTGTAAMLRLRGEIAATAAAAASLIATLSGVPSSVGGGGGNTTINVNNNVTNNSAAAAAASQADVENTFRGNP